MGEKKNSKSPLLTSLGVLDLVGAGQRPVQPLDQGGHRVGRVQRLVRINLARGVGVGSDLPARAVDRFEAGLDGLHGLASREGSQGGHEGLVAHELPELLGAAAGEGVLDLDRAAELLDAGLEFLKKGKKERRLVGVEKRERERERACGERERERACGDGELAADR